MRKLYKKFKKLTGLNMQDMADKVGVSKQHIHASLNNYSMLYKTSMAAIMNSCIDDKINQLEQHISNLKELQKEVINHAIEKDIQGENKPVQTA